LNILLADDSVPAQNMGKKILLDAGYMVVTASNGLDALRKIKESTPDIAILDIFMPGYTGLELCERLRAHQETASLPVILTVGKLEPYRPEDGEHVRSNAVIVKPFAAAELISAVRSLIGAPEAAAEPAEVAPVAAAAIATAAAPVLAAAAVPDVVEAPPSVAQVVPATPAVTPLPEQPAPAMPVASVATAPAQPIVASSVPPAAKEAAAEPSSADEIPTFELPATAPSGEDDEPMFSYALFDISEDETSESPVADHAAPESAAHEVAVASADHVPAEPSAPAFQPASATEAEGHESLLFNPDAGRSPFRASAADLVPSSPSESEASAYSGFDLEPSASSYAAGPDPAFAATQSESVANEYQGYSNVESAPSSGEHHEEPVAAPSDMEAVEPAPQEISVHEPLPTLTQSDAFSAETPSYALAPEVSAPAVAPSGLEAGPAKPADVPPAAPVVDDEEARRLAFEALFNSTEVFPEEEAPPAPAAVTPPEIASPTVDPSVLLPSMADLSPADHVAVTPDSEIEHFADPGADVLEAPEADPFLMEDAEPLNLIGPIPERDPLLDDGELSNWTAPGSTVHPEIPVEAPVSAVDSEPLAEPSELEPALELEAAPAEEALLEEPLAFAEESSELHEEPSPLPAEASHAAESTLPESTAALEPLHFEPEPLAEAAPEPLHNAPEAVADEHEAPLEPSWMRITQDILYTDVLPTGEAPPTEHAEPVQAHEVVPPAPVHQEPSPAPAASEQPAPAPVVEPVAAPVVKPVPEAHVAAEVPYSAEAERLHQAVERVFDRFKPVLVAAIVRELARRD
jgi:CheY-like chemotaxis protein